MKNIPDLSFEEQSDGLIYLQQDSGGNLDRVVIHPLHIRYLAEKFGIVPAGDPSAMATITKLSRRMHLLRDRVAHLGHYLAVHSDHRHADLTYETTYATATADIADEFCADIGDPRELNEGDDARPDPAPARTGKGEQISIEV